MPRKKKEHFKVEVVNRKIQDKEEISADSSVDVQVIYPKDLPLSQLRQALFMLSQRIK